jgi:hypothetical protein
MKVGCRINIFRVLYEPSRKEETMKEDNTEIKGGIKIEREKVKKESKQTRERMRYK